MDLRSCVVTGNAGDLTALHRARTQRKRRARGPTWVGTNIRVLLELLARADNCHSGGAVAVRTSVADALAGIHNEHPSGGEFVLSARSD